MSGSLQAAPERAISKVMRVKPRFQWRPQEVGDASNVECLSRKAAGSKQSQPERGHMACNWQNHGQTVLACWISYHDTLYPRYRTWIFRI
jgi:hypothetical protein